MTEELLEKFKSKLGEIFTPKSEYRDFEISVDLKSNGDLEFKISQMYDYVDITFDSLIKLSELLGTRKFDVNKWSYLGCETCAYGSNYSQEFSVKKEDLNLNL